MQPSDVGLVSVRVRSGAFHFRKCLRARRVPLGSEKKQVMWMIRLNKRT